MGSQMAKKKRGLKGKTFGRMTRKLRKAGRWFSFMKKTGKKSSGGGGRYFL